MIARNFIFHTNSLNIYTGNGARRPERSALRKVEQGTYPLGSATSATPAVTALLTTPQSGGLETMIGHEISSEQPQELPAMQMDQSDAGTLQITEREARMAHIALLK
jgi:hypothetical protein